jgi:ferric-dicitrate binding protein FerR (iron transport regulator)
MTKAERIGELMFKHVRGNTSRKEELKLSKWRTLSPENEEAFKHASDKKKILREVAEMIDSKERVLEKIRQQIPAASYEPRKRSALIVNITRIAAIFFIVLVALMLNPFGQKDPKLLSAFVSPDGAIVAMDDLHSGFLAGRAGLRPHTDENGKEEWIASNFPKDPKDKNFKLISAIRGHLTLRLPENISVWLNNHTAFQYPANFSQDSIHLTVEGEGYIEKRGTRNVQRLTINVNRGTIKEVLIGPGDVFFNINAYPDSVLEITVIKGSLTLNLDSAGSKSLPGVQLVAGQQAQLLNSRLGILPYADIKKVISWKN